MTPFSALVPDDERPEFGLEDETMWQAEAPIQPHDRGRLTGLTEYKTKSGGGSG